VFVRSRESIVLSEWLEGGKDLHLNASCVTVISPAIGL
jgi:hypothetical protein